MYSTSVVEESQAEPELPPEVVEEGTKIVEEFLRAWASQQQDGEDVVMADNDDDSEDQP